MKNFFKSAAAVLAGIIAGAGLSIATDAVLETIGVFPSLEQQMKDGGLFVPWMLGLAALYRTVYTALSGAIGAVLAPKRPMLHVGILGGVALLANLAGLFAAAGMSQIWYPVVLTVLAFPATWIGGTAVLRRRAR